MMQVTCTKNKIKRYKVTAISTFEVGVFENKNEKKF